MYNNEKEFIKWMLRYDDELEYYRNAFKQEHLDTVFENTATLIIEKDLNRYKTGYELFDRLSQTDNVLQNELGPIIQKRGGIEYCPKEIKNAFLDVTAKLIILPYFIKYKYGLDLPSNIFKLKKL